MASETAPPGEPQAQPRPSATVQEPATGEAGDGAGGPRSPLLLHYHIFKNAGTSVDRMLRENFGDAWLEREFTGKTRPERNAEVHTLLAHSPELKAFSSHTAPMPVPELPDRHIVPIIFVRHPLLRIRSAYRFHKIQDASTRGAELAKTTDLRGYVETYLAEPEAKIVRNFQVLRFAAGTPGRPAQALTRALETMARLPFVGLVEAYDESMARLGELARPLFPDFRAITYRENVTGSASEATIDEALAALRDELGEDLFQRLLAENAGDLKLFEDVRARYPGAR